MSKKRMCRGCGKPMRRWGGEVLFVKRIDPCQHCGGTRTEATPGIGYVCFECDRSVDIPVMNGGDDS